MRTAEKLEIKRIRMENGTTVEARQSGYFSMRIRETIESVGKKTVLLLGATTAINAIAYTSTFSSVPMQALGKIGGGILSIPSVIYHISSTVASIIGVGVQVMKDIDEVSFGHLRSIGNTLVAMKDVILSAGVNLYGDFFLNALLLLFFVGVITGSRKFITHGIIGNRLRIEHLDRLWRGKIFQKIGL